MAMKIGFRNFQAVLFSLLFVLCLAACGKKQADTNKTGTDGQVETIVQEGHETEQSTVKEETIVDDECAVANKTTAGDKTTTADKATADDKATTEEKTTADDNVGEESAAEADNDKVPLFNLDQDRDGYVDGWY